MMEKINKFLEGVEYFISRHHGKDVKKTKPSYLPDLFFLIGSSILFFFLTIFVSATLTFLFGGSVSKLQILFGLLTTTAFVFLSSRKLFSTGHILNSLLVLLVFLNSLLFSIYIGGKFYDLSYDGQAYHQEMTIHLKEKWNPFYTSLTNEDTRYAIFLNHYPKGSEIIDASLYALTDKIEYSKGFNILFVLMAFSYLFSLMLRLEKLNIHLALFLSLIFILNPVNIYQSLSFYIDSRIYSLILSHLAILSTLYLTRRNYFLLPFILILPLLVSFKATLFVYSIFFLFFFFLYLFYTERISLLFKCAALALPTILFSFFILNFNPHVTNYGSHGHPLYPAFGRNATDYTDVNAPNNIKSNNSVKKLIISIFSKTNNAKGERPAELKQPFTFDDSELNKLVNTGNNIGGFGVLFSGIILLTSLGFIILFFFRKRWRIHGAFFYIMVVVMLSVLINPAAFYSRFVPQLWIFPAIVTALLLTNRFLILKFVGFAVLSVILLNNYFIFNKYFTYHLEKSEELKRELANLSERSYGEAIVINFDIFRSARLKLNEYKIPYKESKNLECEKKSRLFKGIIDDSKIEICNFH